MITFLAFSAAAFVLWSFMEYVIHRFAFHERRGKNYGSREHLRHHASRDYRLWKNPEAWVGVVLVGAALGVGAWLLVGPAAGWGLGAGYVVAYFTYEAIHGIAHVFAPRTRYGRWYRKHHFHHHFAEPLMNQGVTTPVWDKVFGTFSEPGQVQVPRRMAMRWLVGEDGEVKPEFRGDYALRGRRTEIDEDVEAVNAFANVAPVLDDEDGAVLDLTDLREPARSGA
jgi:sterol desaturase/sphingolipid hydroxylase (fatty acid hydroxylase superfamily)